MAKLFFKMLAVNLFILVGALFAGSEEFDFLVGDVSATGGLIVHVGVNDIGKIAAMVEGGGVKGRSK